MGWWKPPTRRELLSLILTLGIVWAMLLITCFLKYVVGCVGFGGDRMKSQEQMRYTVCKTWLLKGLFNALTSELLFVLFWSTCFCIELGYQISGRVCFKFQGRNECSHQRVILKVPIHGVLNRVKPYVFLNNDSFWWVLLICHGSFSHLSQRNHPDLPLIS